MTIGRNLYSLFSRAGILRVFWSWYPQSFPELVSSEFSRDGILRVFWSFKLRLTWSLANWEFVKPVLQKYFPIKHWVLRIYRLGVYWEAPSFQESFKPDGSRDTVSVHKCHAFKYPRYGHGLVWLIWFGWATYLSMTLLAGCASCWLLTMPTLAPLTASPRSRISPPQRACAMAWL